MKHMINLKAICPHYKHEDSQVIYCSGVQDGSVLHVAFASKTDSLAYKRSMCRDNYKSCRVYRMLEEDKDGKDR